MSSATDLKKRNYLAYLQLSSLLILAMLIGMIGGISLQKWYAIRYREPIKIGDFSDEISLLTFSSIENGQLKGKLEGEEARIVITGADEVVSVFAGDFSFDITEILPNLKQIPAPDGMAFAASKNGKYFYPLDSPRAALISVKNRIFFASREQARKAGFHDGKL
jgi:hypothetical protein